MTETRALMWNNTTIFTKIFYVSSHAQRTACFIRWLMEAHRQTYRFTERHFHLWFFILVVPGALLYKAADNRIFPYIYRLLFIVDVYFLQSCVMFFSCCQSSVLLYYCQYSFPLHHKFARYVDLFCFNVANVCFFISVPTMQFLSSWYWLSSYNDSAAS